MRLRRAFFDRRADIVARGLLGCVLVHDSPEGRTAGIIVETEAYHQDDPASHSFKGVTGRNTPMFMAPGTVYVYFTYGMHYCFNIVTNKKGIGEAVLIRALEPIEGIALMGVRRKRANTPELCSGPARLVQAMGITKAMNGSNVIRGPLSVETGKKVSSVLCTPRIGISNGKETMLRFCVKENGFLSRP